MNNASRVFITQENPNLNYLPAEEFGELVFVTRDDLSPVKNSLNNEHVRATISRVLADFNPHFDYVCVSGSPSVTALCFMILARKHTQVRVLRWSNRDGKYSVIHLNASE